MNEALDQDAGSVSYNNSSLYNSALEDSAALSELTEISNDHTDQNSDSLSTNNSTEFEGSTSSANLNETAPHHANANNIINSNSSLLLIQSEKNESNISQRVDEKIQSEKNESNISQRIDEKIMQLNKTIPIHNEKEIDFHGVESAEATSDEDNELNESPPNLSTSNIPIAHKEKLKTQVQVPICDVQNGLNSTPRKESPKNDTVNANVTKTLDSTQVIPKSATKFPSKSTVQTPVNSAVIKRESITLYDTIEEFESKLPPTVTVLETPFGSKVYLVGTAHFSEESQDDVSFVIRNVRPDFVVVELCPSRIHILKLDEKTLLEEAKNFNLAKIRSIFQTHGYVNGFFFILFLHMSAQIAKELGMAPGGEFRRAFEEIHNLPSCVLQLGDRPINITLQRALRALSLWQIVKLVWRLTSTESITIEEVETCKERDLLSKLMQEMAGEFPEFSDVFVKERDLFLCHSLQLAAVPIQSYTYQRPVRVVGVVGIGHISGIVENWGHVDPSQIPVICEIPPASMGTRVCKYTFKYGLIGLLLFGTYKVLRPRLPKLF